MNGFLGILILFLVISCGDEVDKTKTVVNNYSCKSSQDCKDLERDSCINIKKENDEIQKMCMNTSCDGWFEEDGKIYSYNRRDDGICYKTELN